MNRLSPTLGAVMLLAAILLLVSVSPFPSAAQGAAPTSVTLTEDDAGKTVQLALGGTLQVKLPGNATTGYAWGVISNNDQILQQQGDWDYEPSGTQPGAPGTFVLNFKAVGTGTVNLSLGYKRWWDAASEPEQTFQATVNVVQAPPPSPSPNAPPPSVELTDKNSGETVQIAKGGTLQISLPGNATTGYSWNVTSNDDEVLRQRGSWDYEPSGTQPGAPGTFILNFDAVGLGTSNLVLDYKQPWDDTTAPTQTFSATVNVLPSVPLTTTVPSGGAPTLVQVNGDDSGETVALAQNGILEVSLGGNATTGYTWAVISNNSAVLEQVGKYTYNPSGTQPGAPGTFLFKFEGIAAGTSSLILGYKQWWDEQATPSETFQLTVNVVGAAPPPPTVNLTQADNGKTVSLAQGGALEVELDCNPSTGYSWQVMQVNPAILEQQGDWSVTPKGHLIGAPGTCEVRFLAVGQGTTALQLGYKRWWDKTMPPDPTFQVTVTVE